MKKADPFGYYVRQRIDQLREYENTRLSAEERLELWEALQDGFCKYCGEKLDEHSCPCLKDE